MSSLMIFPFCREFSEFARCVKVLTEYDKVILISPKGFGFEGEDACICDGGDELNILILSDFDEEIKNVNAVFFGYTKSSISVKSYIKKIKVAFDLNKKVYITRDLVDYLGNIDELKQAEILDYNQRSLKENLTKNLLPISVPVVVIAGVGNNCDKFNIQLKLRDLFNRNGYQVMNFGSKKFSGLFGIETLPQFLFDNLDNSTKIRQLNAYINELVNKEKPDVVIIGIPGGIMQLNPFKFDEFGELAFLISNAIKADISILSIYKQDYNKEFLDNLINLCKYRYNFNVNYINIANTDFYISPEEKECQYTTILSNHIIEKINNSPQFDNVQLFSSLNDISMKETFDKIVIELENNI
jgi:peptide maturation system protein (TIGR04066 family)